MIDHRILILTTLLASTAGASEWRHIENKDLEIALAYGIELANSDSAPVSYPFIRLYAVPEVVGECGGTVESCPDWRLYMTVSMGDLYEEPLLFQFPSSKGWEFMGWQQTDEPQLTRFKVATTLPGANIDSAAREDWHAEVHEISVGPNGPISSSILGEKE